MELLGHAASQHSCSFSSICLLSAQHSCRIGMCGDSCRGPLRIKWSALLAETPCWPAALGTDLRWVTDTFT